MQTVADAREAARGGADRLEVVRDLESGGLTPPLALVAAIAAETALPLRVMVRENAGFMTTAASLRNSPEPTKPSAITRMPKCTTMPP